MDKQPLGKPMFDLIHSDSIRHAESANPFYCARSEAIEVEILTMAGQMNATQHRFLTLLFDFDEHDRWQGDSMRSFTHWLNSKISYSKVRAMTRVANPENEAFLLQVAEYGPLIT